MTAQEWVQKAKQKLEKAGVPEFAFDSQMLAAHSVNMPRSWLLAHPEAEISETADQLLERRMAREPLAYILGWREFYGRQFIVEPGVLIPRQETEVLIDIALEGLGGNVLDVGTGSGCIGVTMKLERPNWMVAACDISTKAIRVARANAKKFDATVLVTRSDLFGAFEGTRFGIILSNPPYIDKSATLMPEVALFEPAEALFAEENGFEVYRRIAENAQYYLMPWGRLILELGDNMAEQVSQIFADRDWIIDEIRSDLGGMPRAIVLKLS